MSVHPSLEAGAVGNALTMPGTFQAGVRDGGGVWGVLIYATPLAPRPTPGLLLLTFVSVVGNLAQVNEVGADGHVVDLV